MSLSGQQRDVLKAKKDENAMATSSGGQHRDAFCEPENRDYRAAKPSGGEKAIDSCKPKNDGIGRQVR